ncbi:transposable element Tcb2 transposase [Trichonephila clavipes]|uniref:Transposable element Tcb2 transposase n=1 Tax=Trichonephila clavipes TaxID=2585209 RepID=A0A8X6SD83_TRICX|nr:transposable element Tcb2 transposase [Trichonephila clavipes]
MITPFSVTMGPTESHNVAAHIMVDPPTCLIVESRQSRSYACEGVLQTCTHPVVRKTLPWPARSPDLSPVEHMRDQLKQQKPSCHSVHDLELAVQDLEAHLPQDNIRCLINSMPDV